MPATDKKITSLDFVARHGDEVRYTQAGLRLYCALCKEYELPLPLPRMYDDWRALAWAIIDAQADEMAEIIREGPDPELLERMSAREKVAGRLSLVAGSGLPISPQSP